MSAEGRVGTFCWNTGRHLELYLGAPCTRRVLHTLNIRLFPEQLVYIAHHAGAEVVFVDRSLIPLLALKAFGGNAAQSVPFGGTSILIIVGVGLETVKKIQAQLQQRNYEGFLR